MMISLLMAPQHSDAPLPGEVIRGSHEEPAGTRSYRLFLPDARSETRAEATASPPLVVLLHGCTQDAEDLARGTRMDLLAGPMGVAVLYPEQDPAAHPARCWNWYEPGHQARGDGEPSIVAGMIRALVDRHGLDPARVYVAGVSAGGALAATLSATYPELMAGGASHSGVPFGIVQGLADAMQAMTGTLDVEPGAAAEAFRAAAEASHAAAEATDSPVPFLVIHGGVDGIVSPRAAAWFEAQWEHLLSPAQDGENREMEVSEVEGAGWSARTYRDHEGTVRFRIVLIPALGHAWSGGDPEGTFTDPTGPDASRMLLEFFGLASREGHP